MTKTEFIAVVMAMGCSEQEAAELWANGFRTVRSACFYLENNPRGAQ